MSWPWRAGAPRAACLLPCRIRAGLWSATAWTSGASLTGATTKQSLCLSGAKSRWLQEIPPISGTMGRNPPPGEGSGPAPAAPARGS